MGRYSANRPFIHYMWTWIAFQKKMRIPLGLVCKWNLCVWISSGIYKHTMETGL